MTVGEELAEQLKHALLQSDFITVLVDGSIDCSVIKKELIYLCFVDADDCLQCFDAVCWAAGRASGL